MKEDIMHVGKRSVIISYITQFFQYSSSLILLPFILSKLDSDTLGVWYLFLSVSAFANLLDFGISSSLSRQLSYVFSGAKFLLKEGNPPANPDKSINFELLKSVLYTTKKTYKQVAIVMFLLLSTFGTIYIFDVSSKNNYDSITIQWLFFVLSTSFNYYLSYITVFVRGRGLINIYNYTIIINRITNIAVTLFLIYCGLGLWALVVANFVSATFSRFYGYFVFFDNNLKEGLDKVKSEPDNMFSIIWYNAKKFGIASFTTFAFSQANIFLAGFYLPVAQVAELGLALQCFQVIVTCSRVSFNTYYPKICALWLSNGVHEIRQLFIKTQILGYLIWLLGFAVLVFWGNDILFLIHSNTSIPSNGIICLYAFFYLMELTHGNCSILISSQNTVPFLNASIYACITSLVLMIVFLNNNLGLYSFPLAMVCANLPYNSWKWVWETYKILK